MSINTTDLGNDMWAQQAYDSIWGREEAFSTVINGIESLHSTLEPRFLPGYRVIVREEYNLLWNEIMLYAPAEDGSHKAMVRGMVVWGHPGIGKSLSLRFLLGRCLAKRRAVIFCESPGYCLYFHQHGVQKMHYTGPLPLIPSRIIVLCDSNVSMPFPNGFFLSQSTSAFVVQATSESPWKGWSKKLSARMWVMNPWSREEIRQLDILRKVDPGYYTALEVCDYFGPNPRECLAPMAKTAYPERDFSLRSISLKNTEQLLSELLAGSIEHNDQCGGFDYYFYVYRNQNSGTVLPRCSTRGYCHHLIPTQFLRRKLFEVLRQQPLDEQRSLCRRISSIPSLCGTAYEVLGVQFFAFQHTPIIFNFCDSNESIWTVSNKIPINRLPACSPVLNADFPDVVWVPSSGFPTVDAVVVSNGGQRISLLQMTITGEHDIKPEGISRIWRLIGEPASNLQWEFIFVVPSKEIGLKLCARRKRIVQRSPAPLNCDTRSGRIDRPGIEMQIGYTVASFMTDKEIEAMEKHFEFLDQPMGSGILEIPLDGQDIENAILPNSVTASQATGATDSVPAQPNIAPPIAAPILSEQLAINDVGADEVKEPISSANTRAKLKGRTRATGPSTQTYVQANTSTVPSTTQPASTAHESRNLRPRLQKRKETDDVTPGVQSKKARKEKHM